MMRRIVLVFGLLTVVCLFEAEAAQACGRYATRCCYAASPCYWCVPTCSWTCCDPCCGWSCCYYRYSTCRCYCVVPSQAASGCSACAPAAPSPSGTNLTPIPEKGAAPPNK